MDTDTLRNILYEHRGSPELLLEAYKRGCRDEREAAKRRAYSLAACPECGGCGEILRDRPKHAVGTYGKDTWEFYYQECWRCSGDGIARPLNANTGEKYELNSKRGSSKSQSFG